MINYKNYSELLRFKTFEERFNYLKCEGSVGKETFGFSRWINQNLYNSNEYKRLRRDIIIRDNGCDLGIQDRQISSKIFIHHMNPITKEDIMSGSKLVWDPEFLICVSFETHNAIHYSDSKILISDPIIRAPNDTCPWRR